MRLRPNRTLLFPAGVPRQTAQGQMLRQRACCQVRAEH